MKLSQWLQAGGILIITSSPFWVMRVINYFSISIDLPDAFLMLWTMLGIMSVLPYYLLIGWIMITVVFVVLTPVFAIFSLLK